MPVLWRVADHGTFTEFVAPPPPRLRARALSKSNRAVRGVGTVSLSYLFGVCKGRHIVRLSLCSVERLTIFLECGVVTCRHPPLPLPSPAHLVVRKIKRTFFCLFDIVDSYLFVAAGFVWGSTSTTGRFFCAVQWKRCCSRRAASLVFSHTHTARVALQN